MAAVLQYSSTGSESARGRLPAERSGGGMRFRFGLTVLVLLSASLLVAQVNTGVISGTVRDKAGAVLPGSSGQRTQRRHGVRAQR